MKKYKDCEKYVCDKSLLFELVFLAKNYVFS